MIPPWSIQGWNDALYVSLRPRFWAEPHHAVHSGNTTASLLSLVHGSRKWVSCAGTVGPTPTQIYAQTLQLSKKEKTSTVYRHSPGVSKGLRLYHTDLIIHISSLICTGYNVKAPCMNPSTPKYPVEENTSHPQEAESHSSTSEKTSISLKSVFLISECACTYIYAYTRPSVMKLDYHYTHCFVTSLC